MQFLHVCLRQTLLRLLKKIPLKFDKKQVEKDFSSIVHRLALYMGSGLSFMSAVDRISKDYIRRRDGQGKRYAFEKILIMDKQMKAGVSQTRACRNWGDQFRGTGYQKLSLILI